MSDFLDFELEDLSEAFATVAEGFSQETQKNDKIELEYQEEQHGIAIRLSDHDVSNISQKRGTTCSDSRTILQRGESRTEREKPPIDFDFNCSLQERNGNQDYSLRHSSNSTYKRKLPISREEQLSNSTRKAAKTENKQNADIITETTQHDLKERETELFLKERKCAREKQRRAELNSAYESLAKTLSLPLKCNKTALLMKADETIKALRQQVNQLLKTNSTLLIAGQNSDSKAQKTSGITVPVPWIVSEQSSGCLRSHELKANSSTERVQSDSTEKALVEQMKVCLDRMLQLHETRSRVQDQTESITHSHCA